MAAHDSRPSATIPVAVRLQPEGCNRPHRGRPRRQGADDGGHAPDLHRRHEGGRHPLPPRQRRIRQEIPAGNDGLRAPPSSTPTATARRTSCFVNSMSWPGRPARRSLLALYRNNRDGTFTDVTAASGLGVALYGLGAAAADYDNDGRTDLYITALGKNRLFRNLGGLRFADVTDAAGVGNTGFSTSAAWLDYDRDGRLDLFVANYVDWSIEKDLLLHARRQVEVVLHARVVQGSEPGALSQRRQWQVRGRDEESRVSTTRPRRRSASRCSITTATAGSTCSSPTTRSRTASTRTSRTAPSPTSPSRRAWRSTKRASRAPAWASTPPTTTAPAGRAWSSATSPTR